MSLNVTTSRTDLVILEVQPLAELKKSTMRGMGLVGEKYIKCYNKEIILVGFYYCVISETTHALFNAMDCPNDFRTAVIGAPMLVGRWFYFSSRGPWSPSPPQPEHQVWYKIALLLL